MSEEQIYLNLVHDGLKAQIEENNKDKLFNRKLIAGLTCALFALVLVIILQHIYYDYSFKKFMSQYDLEQTTQVFSLKDNGSGNVHDINKIAK